MMNLANPFALSPQYWKVVFVAPQIIGETAEDAFNDIALAVSCFEEEEDSGIWVVDVLFGDRPDMAEFQRRLSLIAALHKLPMPDVRMEAVVQEDWLAKVAKDFPPMRIGRFYVHGSHVTDASPRSTIPIQVEAGAAFGSGEHGTTRCCLEAMDWLAKQRRFEHILDVGCGSGILGIAAAKLWHSKVLASDIDAVAVRVTKDNIAKNRVGRFVRAVVSDGYASSQIKRNGPYDLILANILARPLMMLADDLEAHLAPHGVAVLSGLLADQETMVRFAHRTQGLTLVRRFVYNGWCTLVLSR